MRSIHVLLVLFLYLLTACGTPHSTDQVALATIAPTTPGRADAVEHAATVTLETASTQPADRFTDPFAYCTAVTTIDAPDDRFIGAPVPTEIVQELHHVTGGQGPAPDWLPKTVQWRCMNGKVYACTIGANLPCSDKANTSQTPTDALKEFCTQHPERAGVEETNSIYVWTCTGGTPKIERQWTEADAAGFLAKIWYEIKAP